MRLICPNCGAQYEVPDDQIPASGRDVQCSNCNHTWFEQPGASVAAEEGLTEIAPAPGPEPGPEPEPEPVPEPEPEPEPVTEPGPAPAPTEPSRKSLSPEVAAILQAERAREEAARRAEAASLESQPDLGIEEPTRSLDREQRRAEEVRRRMARMKGAAAPPQAATRRELLPDIEEINSSLRSTADRTQAASGEAEVQQRHRRGFRLGFATALLIASALAGLYLLAPALASRVPAAAPALDSYVDVVDAARLWLDLRLQDLTAMLSGDTPPPTENG